MLQNLTTQQAAAQIVGLINASPRSPRQDEIEAIIASVVTRQDAPAPSALATKIRAAMEPVRAAINAEGNLLSKDPGYAETVALARRLEGELYALCKELWATPVTSFDDLLIRAEVAQFDARDWPAPYAPWPMLHEDSMDECSSNEEFRQLAAAVLSLGQRPVAIPAAPQDSTSPALAAEYRRLRAEADALWRRSGEVENEETSERIAAEASAIETRLTPIERAIWAAPTRTFDHIVLLAEVALSNENGLLGCVKEADPYHDERSLAELMLAVLDMAGRRPS